MRTDRRCDSSQRRLDTSHIHLVLPVQMFISFFICSAVMSSWHILLKIHTETAQSVKMTRKETEKLQQMTEREAYRLWSGSFIPASLQRRVMVYIREQLNKKVHLHVASSRPHKQALCARHKTPDTFSFQCQVQSRVSSGLRLEIKRSFFCKYSNWGSSITRLCSGWFCVNTSKTKMGRHPFF